MTPGEHVIIRGAGAASALGGVAGAGPYAPTGPAFSDRVFAPPGARVAVAALPADLEADR